MKKRYGFGVLIFFILAYSIVGHLDYKLMQQEETWKESVQALEVEQEKIQAKIEESRELLLKADKTLKEHHLLIWDIRNRLHLDLEAQLEK